ncbi:unnamed protein product [Cuscuta campestris]|uniref:Uncharacterized protein n=1 Tax=Cuscuta campestris TaxID=132261 RepID=A0A484L0U5_9ASTE|nr:unnamed protein product [Cuscuta campestris]
MMLKSTQRGRLRSPCKLSILNSSLTNDSGLDKMNPMVQIDLNLELKGPKSAFCPVVSESSGARFGRLRGLRMIRKGVLHSVFPFFWLGGCGFVLEVRTILIVPGNTSTDMSKFRDIFENGFKE